MPEPTLQTTALRYAARDLTAVETAAFETLLGADQDARDALAEAVRLSAAALGQVPPTPDRSFRIVIRERLTGYCPMWFRRRAYRGHPAAWLALGAVAVAASTVIGLALAGGDPIHDAIPAAATTPAAPDASATLPNAHESDSTGFADTCGSDDRSIAEIWAHLSTPDHVEKVHDDELRWRQKLREASVLHPGRVIPTSATTDQRVP